MSLDRLVQLVGALDLFNVGFYVYRQIVLGRTPLIDDLLSAHALGADMPTLFPPPLLVASMGALFLLSMIASGVLLMLRTAAGGWLSIAQSPFRPFTWWSAAPLLSVSSSNVLPLVVAVEVCKLIAVIAWLRNRTGLRVSREDRA